MLDLLGWEHWIRVFFMSFGGSLSVYWIFSPVFVPKTWHVLLVGSILACEFFMSLVFVPKTWHEFFFLKHLFRPKSNRFGACFGSFQTNQTISDWIGLYRAVSENEERKKKDSSQTHVKLCRPPHSSSMHVGRRCTAPWGTPVLSSYLYAVVESWFYADQLKNFLKI